MKTLSKQNNNSKRARLHDWNFEKPRRISPRRHPLCCSLLLQKYYTYWIPVFWLLFTLCRRDESNTFFLKKKIQTAPKVVDLPAKICRKKKKKRVSWYGIYFGTSHRRYTEYIAKFRVFHTSASEHECHITILSSVNTPRNQSLSSRRRVSFATLRQANKTFSVDSSVFLTSRRPKVNNRARDGKSETECVKHTKLFHRGPQRFIYQRTRENFSRSKHTYLCIN